MQDNINGLSKEDWESLFISLLPAKKEPLLDNIIKNIGWPDKDTFVSAITNDRSFGVSDYYLIVDGSDSTSRSSNDQLYLDLMRKKEARSSWWGVTFDKFNIDLTFLNLNKKLLYKFSNEDLSDPISQAIRNTKDKSVIKKWLNQKTTMVVANNAHDKGDVLAMLIMTGNKDVLDTISEFYPEWIDHLDKKGRNPFFFARSASMVSYLLDKGVDIEHKNKDGQTAESFWLEKVQAKNCRLWIDTIKNFKINESTPEEIEQINTDSMVFKVFSLAPNNFTEDERVLFDKACENLENWTWEGKLGGVERNWTLIEAWKFGELMFGLGEMPSPEGISVGYGGRSDSNRFKFLYQLATAFDTIRKRIPNNNFKKALKDKDRKQTMGERVFDWLIRKGHSSPKNVDNLPIFVENRGYGYGFYSTHSHPNDKNDDKSMTRDFINSFKKKNELDEWVKEMAPLWDIEALYDWGTPCSYKMATILSLSTYPKKNGGLAIKENTDIWSTARQNEEFRKIDYARHWISGFLENQLSTIKTSGSNKSIAKITPVDLWYKHKENGEDLKGWEPVLRSGLMVLGHPDISENVIPKRLDEVEKALKDMIDSGVNMDKIPLRWAKNYRPTLRTAVDKWVIKTNIEKSSKRKKIDISQPTPRKRKM